MFSHWQHLVSESSFMECKNNPKYLCRALSSHYWENLILNLIFTYPRTD